MNYKLFFFCLTLNSIIFSSLPTQSYHRPYPPYYSQVGQDKYINENIFHNKRNGVFIDIGAHDGISFSNSYYFEKELGWTGFCFEPHPDKFQELRKNRACECIQACISNYFGKAQFLKVVGAPEMLSGLTSSYDPRHLDRVDLEISMNGGTKELIDVEVLTLESVLAKNAVQKIDFISIDTEGSEFAIITSIDWHKFDIDVVVIENNFNDKKISEFLINQGYKFLKQIDGDQIYQKIQS